MMTTKRNLLVFGIGLVIGMMSLSTPWEYDRNQSAEETSAPAKPIKTQKPSSTDEEDTMLA